MNPAVQRYRDAQHVSRTEPDREAFIRAYLPLVRRVAHRIARELPAGIDVNDLVSAGCVGLVGALTRFDPDRGLDFGTFAEFRIKGAILDELRALDPVPRRSRRKLRNLERARRKLTAELGRPPSDDEVASHLDMTLDDYHLLVGNLSPGFDLSLTLIDRGAGAAKLAEHNCHHPPDRIHERRELRQRLADSVRHLPERMRTVISLYYYARLSYKEIAVLFDVTESRICQIHRSAVGKMRTTLEHDGGRLAEGCA